MSTGTMPLFNWSLTCSSWLFSGFILKMPSAFRPSCVYKRSCINKRMVGTLLPLVSYEHCIDSAETPKTLTLQLGTLQGISTSNSTGRPRKP
nr:Os12g0155250 [Ipomoea batatas]